MKKLLISLLSIIIISPAVAQIYPPDGGGYWKQHRIEFFGGVGSALYRGDLGGSSNQFVDSWLKGQEFDQLRPAVHFGARYFLTSNFSLRGDLSYARLYGSDQNAESVYRKNRNLQFRSNVIELSVMGEIHITKEKTQYLYDLNGVKAKPGFSLGTYLFAGFGAFYFDPQGFYDIDGVGSGWAYLQPLGTEGQLLEGGNGKYSRIAYSIPVGIGVKKSLTKNMSVGIELSYRFTSTDYLDDVSTKYANTNAIAATSGPVAAYLADPSLGANLTQLDLELLDFPGRASWTAEGQQRGNPEGNDAFMMATITLTYKLFQNPSTFNKRGAKAKRKKIKPLVF